MPVGQDIAYMCHAPRLDTGEVLEPSAGMVSKSYLSESRVGHLSGTLILHDIVWSRLKAKREGEKKIW